MERTDEKVSDLIKKVHILVPMGLAILVVLIELTIPKLDLEARVLVGVLALTIGFLFSVFFELLDMSRSLRTGTRASESTSVAVSEITEAIAVLPEAVAELVTTQVEDHSNCVNITSRRPDRYRELLRIVQKRPSALFWAQRSSGWILGPRVGASEEDAFQGAVLSLVKTSGVEVTHLVSLDGLQQELGEGDPLDQYPTLYSAFWMRLNQDRAGRLFIRGTERNPQYIYYLQAGAPNNRARFLFAKVGDLKIEGVIPIDFVDDLSLIVSGEDERLMDFLYRTVNKSNRLRLSDLLRIGLAADQVPTYVSS
ncbi:MAG: hypothetical protein WB681_08390 [Candidatus Cybelea sp.]